MDAVFTCIPRVMRKSRFAEISGFLAFLQQCPEFWALDAALVLKVPAVPRGSFTNPFAN